MIALLALAWLQAPALTATVEAPSTVELGVPFELVVELSHGEGPAPRLLPEAVGEGWVVLSEDGAITLRGETPTTRVRWTVCALEPLEAALPELMAELPDRSVQAPYVDPEAPRIEVRGVLASDEDSARPPRGFRDDPASSSEGLPWWAIPAALAALLCAACAAVWRLRRGAGPSTATAEPEPLERLARIDPGALDGPEEVRAAYYEITAAVRGGLDRRLGVRRDGLTDAEWVAALADQPVDPARRELLGDLFESCAAVKYGGGRPTHWAVQETLDRAREALASSVDVRDPVDEVPA